MLIYTSVFDSVSAGQELLLCVFTLQRKCCVHSGFIHTNRMCL